MVALSDVAQALDRLQKVADGDLSLLRSALPPLERAGREAIQRVIAEGASVLNRGTSTPIMVGSEVSVDAAVARLDPTVGLNSKTFTVDGAKGHPWIKEDLTHLSHATVEKERHDREHGRKSTGAFINPVPNNLGIVPWARTEPPQMRESAERQTRHPLVKY